MAIEEPDVAATRVMRRRRVLIHMGLAGIERPNRIQRVLKINGVAGQRRLGRHLAHVRKEIAVVSSRMSDIDIIDIALAPFIFIFHKAAQRSIQVRADGTNATAARIVICRLRWAEKHFLVTHVQLVNQQIVIGVGGITSCCDFLSKGSEIAVVVVRIQQIGKHDLLEVGHAGNGSRLFASL